MVVQAVILLTAWFAANMFASSAALSCIGIFAPTWKVESKADSITTSSLIVHALQLLRHVWSTVLALATFAIPFDLLLGIWPFSFI